MQYSNLIFARFVIPNPQNLLEFLDFRYKYCEVYISGAYSKLH